MKLLLAISCALILQYAVTAARSPNVNDNRALFQGSDFGDNSRTIADVWENIKITAQKTWDAVKNTADRTKATIKAWLDKVREQAKKISKMFEERIEIIKEDFKNFLENLIVTGQLVKECVREENETIEQLFTQIIDYVTTCVADNLTKLKTLEDHDFISGINATKYLEKINTKINKCSEEIDGAKCLEQVRKDIFEEMDIVENGIFEGSAESRGAADDILDAVLACALRGVSQASDVMAALLHHTVACVANNNNNNNNSNTTI